MQTMKQLEAFLVHELFRRGLPRTPGPLGFAYQGNVVRVTVNESLYRGPFVTVHDKPYASRQFRAIDGAYDWDAIARAIVDVVVRKRHARAAQHSRFDGAEVPLSIRPSTATPGRLRVQLKEMELDPAAVMQLFALVRDATPARVAEPAIYAAPL